MRWLRWGSLLLLCFATPALGEKGKAYTMEDLLALERSGGWAEIDQHLMDVPPAKRSAEWEGLAERSALELLKAIAADKEPLAGAFIADELLKRFPHLSKARAFLDRRAAVGLEGFARCFENSYQAVFCNEKLTAFVEKDEENVDLAFRAGKLVSLHMRRDAAAPYFVRALAGRKDAKECADGDVKLAVSSGLSLPESHANMALARRLGTELCWAALSDALTEEFHKTGKGDYYFQNLCGTLKARGMLGNLQAKQCGAR